MRVTALRPRNSAVFLPRRLAGTSTSPHVFKVTTHTWQELVENSATPVIVDAKADWCGPCKVLGPRLEKAVTEAGGALKLAILDVEESADIAGKKLEVMSIPAVFAYHKGQIVDKFVGNIPEPQLQQFVQKLKALK